MTEHTFLLPNTLVLDTALSYTAKKLGTFLYSLKAKNVQVTFLAMANEIGTSIATLQKNLRELENSGYIWRQKKLRYNTTHICLQLPAQESCTPIPNSVLSLRLHPGSFCVFLYLLYFDFGWSQGPGELPSPKAISKVMCISEATIYRALGEIRAILKEKERKGETEYEALSSSLIQ